MDKIKYALKAAANLWKESVILFVYMIMEGIVSFLILNIDSVGLQIFLLIINIAFFAFLSIIICKSTGEKQYKAKVTGDIRRNKGVEEDIKKYCKPEGEYHFFNGILLGILTSSILYIMLIVRVFVSGTKTGYDAVIKLINFLYSSLLLAINKDASVYYLLLFSLITIGACSFGYYLGAKKIKNQQDRLQKTHEEIYGKGNNN